MAPELFDADDAGHKTTVSSRASDIYALSMVVIEDLPFFQSRDDAVMLRVVRGVRPDKPVNASELGVSDIPWKMVERCWNHEPKRRPDISSVLDCFAAQIR